MPDTPFLLRRVVVAAHSRIPDALTEAAAISSYFTEHGLEAAHGTLDDISLRKCVKEGAVDLMVAVGGDGTMLRVSHLCGPNNVPILGINMGRLGFLMQFRREEWKSALEKLLKGEFWIENRMMLRAEHSRAGEVLGNWHALNEAVVTRASVHPVRLSASVDGMQLSNYVADGLIVATPTGSTGYALAAGGPILPPELRNILLVAIAPHLSVDRAIVLAQGSKVDIVVHATHEMLLSADGQAAATLVDGDLIRVRRSEHSAWFARVQPVTYFYTTLMARMAQKT